MNLKLKKKTVLRQRFLKAPVFPDLAEWVTELSSLKNFLSTSSNYQIVGNQVHFEVSASNTSPQLMLQVIGLPMNFDQNGPVMVDREAREILIHELAGQDIFSIDFKQLLLKAENLHLSLKEQMGSSLGDVYDIVFVGEKIELHFFRQKDYIQG